jgi:hypothetical protein
LPSISDDAAIISAIGIVLGTAFVLIELRHMEMHRNLDVSMKLFEWAESDRLRKAFRWVESEFKFEDCEKYRTREASDFEVADYPHEVAAFFEQVGFLVAKKFVDLDIIDDRLGPHIVSSWKILEPWIMSQRKEKNDHEFGRHFQKLYERTIEYMK